MKAYTKLKHRTSEQKSCKEAKKILKECFIIKTSLTNISLSSLNIYFEITFFPLHQVFFCRMHVSSQLLQFRDTIQAKIISKKPYKVSIGAMHLTLQELQDLSSKAQNIRLKELQIGRLQQDTSLRAYLIYQKLSNPSLSEGIIITLLRSF